MKEIGLESHWREWKESEEGKEAFFAQLAKILYAEPGRFGFDDVDQAADTLSYHRERVISLLDRYEDRGSSFEHYVASSLRFFAKSYRRDTKRLLERDMACERALRFSDDEECEWEGRHEAMIETVVDRASGRATGLSPRRHRKTRDSRLLCLLMKCAWEAGDVETRLAAELTGVSEAWLSMALAQARRFLEIERCRFEKLTARRNRAWSALRINEARLAEESNEVLREGLVHGIARSRKEYESALAELKNFRPLVPNSVIARLLKLPKGSVDSGIHYLKKQGRTCPGDGAQASLEAWNSLSPPVTRISSSNSAPYFPDTSSSVPRMSGIRPLMSRRTAQPMSRMP